MQNLCHLLRISLGFSPADSFPQLNDEQWKALNDAAVKQTVIGLTWGGIEKLPLEKQPPRRLKLQWLADTNEIKRRNEWMDKACVAVMKKLDKAGLSCAILKGQAIAKLYPTPEYRSPGDIDALVSLCPPVKEGGKTQFVISPDVDKTVKDIVGRLKALGKGELGQTVYHHVEWRFTDVVIEVHLRPMQFNNPQTNKRFQQWTKRFTLDPTIEIPTPDVEFNIIYLLSHLYHHLLFEGVGLRQVCDYAVLLRNAASRWQDEKERSAVLSRVKGVLNRLRMKRFAAGMMWIMQTMFELPKEILITEPDAKIGSFMLNEIEKAGNFGKYDDRIDHEKLSPSTTGRFWVLTKHRARFLTLFPSEILWDIPFRLWHYLWRQRYSLILLPLLLLFSLQTIAQNDTISTAYEPDSRLESSLVERTRNGASHWGYRLQGRLGTALVMDEYQRRWQKNKDMSNYDLQLIRTWLPSDSDAFAKDFNYPNLTIGLRYDNYHHISTHRNEDPAWGMLQPVDYDSYMSDMITLYGKFERPLLRTEHWLLDYQLGVGVGYSGRKYNTTDCIDNELIGSHLNIFFTAGVSATYHVADDWGVTAGLEFAHHSNGALARPNKGVNTLGPFLGITYCPYYKAQLIPSDLPTREGHDARKDQNNRNVREDRKNRSHWYCNIDFGIGGKTLLEDWLYTQFNTPPGDPDYRTEKFSTYLACALSAHAMYRYQRRWASGVGVDVFRASYSNREAELDKLFGYADCKHSPWSIGLSAHHEVFFGRFSVPMTLGYYLFREMGEKAKQNEKKYYERIGVRYRPFGKKSEHSQGWECFMSGIAFGFNINAHATKADYTEFVVSVPVF